MSKLKVILFDLDGTLVDSESLHFECWNELLLLYNVQLEYTRYLNEYAGVPVLENTKKLLNLYKIDESLTALVETRQKLYAEKISKQPIRLMPHAFEVVHFLDSLKIPLGLVTSSSRSEANIILQRSNLKPFFSSIITRDDVDKPKPHPAPYDASLTSLALRKDECIVFEDSLSGTISAKEAGLTCYAIQNSDNEIKKLEGIADKIFRNLLDAKEYLLSNRTLALQSHTAI